MGGQLPVISRLVQLIISGDKTVPLIKVSLFFRNKKGGVVVEAKEWSYFAERIVLYANAMKEGAVNQDLQKSYSSLKAIVNELTTVLEKLDQK